jgi:signal transduction histidine kinase
MKIRTKTLNIIAFSLVVLALGNFLVLKALVFPTFVSLEHEAAAKDMHRAVAAIDTQLSDLSATLRDYSAWDDSYNYALGQLPSYPDVLAPDVVGNLNIALIEIYDRNKNQLYAAVYDQEPKELRHADWSFLKLDEYRTLFSDEQTTRESQGIVATPEGLFLFAARPILLTSGEGPPAGTYIFGRLLNEGLVDKIRNTLEIEFDVIALERISDNLNDKNAFGNLTRSGQRFLVDGIGADDYLISYALLRDFRGEPVVLLKGRVRRDITSVGERVLWASVAGVALSGFIVMIIIGLLLQWLLVGPLVNLTRSIVAIGGSGDISRRVSLGRSDEIGILSREFDKMLGSLAEIRNRLLEHSYRSGVAEMASGVLHNLRNQLTPVNMHLERVRDRLAGVPQSKIGVALDELTGNAPPPERVAKLAAYVRLSVEDIVRRQEGSREELAGVAQDLVRIEEILKQLDRFSHAGAQLEAVSLGEVVEETIGLLPEFRDLKVRVKVDPELKNQPPVLSMSFILKHVLHNLFVNAFEAIIATGRKEGIIEVSAACETIDGQPMAHLQVRDDGIGITPEHMREIFVRGFTTKKGGRRGTGLHWCANRIAAMGGKLFAESPGRDAGATLHVMLLLAAAAPKAAAQ